MEVEFIIGDAHNNESARWRGHQPNIRLDEESID